MERVEDLIKRRDELRLGGGEEKVLGQHSKNKMTARERVIELLDEGSFIEIGAFVKDSSVITGYGTIDEKLVYVFSEDVTVNGALINGANGEKISNIMDMALKMGSPLIHIYDSVGGDLKDGLKTLNAYSKIVKNTSKLSGIIPQVALITGGCNGMASISASMCDFIILVDDNGNMSMSSTRDLIDEEEAFIDEKSIKNRVHFNVKEDKEGIVLIKKLLTYLPSNNMELPEVSNYELNNFINEEFDVMSNNDEVDIRKIAVNICDENSNVELFKDFDYEVVTSLGKINGHSFGIIGTNLKDKDLSRTMIEKITRMVKICDAYHIPMVTLVDAEGFKASLEDENKGLSVKVAKMVYALCESSSPKVALIVGKAYGSSYITLASKEGIFDVVYAWPNAKISLTKPEKLIKALNREQITSAENPKVKERELIENLIDDITSPYKAAEAGLIDDIIIPRETRARLFMVFDMLQSKREIKHPKNHGTVLI